ncbi:WhiB family transcriptional regulator [Rhodococcus aetherivorans]|uniref:WhiB family transcriptional regulator n=1 Tax=Rhodococcus aetherivorans TaxID=191292 RepID=UPI003671FA1E
MNAHPPARIAEVVADLDRLGVPVAAGRPVAQAALQAAGRGVSTAVLRAAIAARKQRDGVPVPPRRKPAPKTADGPRRVPLPPLLAAMIDGRLAGAACVGRHALFDDELDGAREDATARAARRTAAAAICATCPVLEACRTVANEAGDQARGVWAGHPRNPSRPVTPSRKDLSA